MALQTTAAGDHYRTQLELARRMLQHASSRWHRVGWLRGGTFLVSLALLLCGLFQAAGTFRPWYWSAGSVFLGFLAVAFWHEWLGDTIRINRLRVQQYRDALLRYDRKLKEVWVRPVEVPAGVAEVSRDLDLFGPHSLHKLLGSVWTPEGIRCLGDWLARPARPAEVIQRQLAARSLSAETVWREEFELLVRRLAGPRPAVGEEMGVDPESVASGLVHWCRSPEWLKKRQLLLWTARLVAAVVVIASAGLLTGLLPLSLAGPLILLAAPVNFFLAVFFSGSIHDEFNQVHSGHRRISVYQRLFQMIDECRASGGRLDDLRHAMFSGGDDVRQEIGRLGRLAGAASLRNNSLLFVPWLMLQFTLFYDIHILVFLENWKRRHGQQAAGWFRALGEWESLAAIGRLAWEHPTWCWPVVLEADGRDDRFLAEEMGHPLIAVPSAVVNSVAVGPQGRFLLVTGSNMSGKSTLLRSIGLNVFLAQIGAPVFARSMQVPCVEVSTSMRVSDSLSDGVSFFMAELKRLKSIVDLAERKDREPGRGQLFLLDEILQGTNSRERQIAVAAVVGALLRAGSIGAVSTHDLELAGHAELGTRCDTVHFREHFSDLDGQRRMQFDYRMRPGISPTTNALKLLEMVGLATAVDGERQIPTEPRHAGSGKG